MSKRTWVCVPCRKSYRRKQSLTSVECPRCHGPCESVDPYVRIPSPERTKEWDQFWAIYKAQKKSETTLHEALQRIEQESPQVAKRRRRLAAAEKRVSYVESISTPLIETLNHSAGLPANQLAGHVANLDFWIGEAKHCLAVIDGYRERFDRLRVGQAEYERQHDVVGAAPPLRRGAKEHTRQDLRGGVCDAIERFLVRCRRENLLSEKDFESALGALRIQTKKTAEPADAHDGGISVRGDGWSMGRRV